MADVLNETPSDPVDGGGPVNLMNYLFSSPSQSNNNTFIGAGTKVLHPKSTPPSWFSVAMGQVTTSNQAEDEEEEDSTETHLLQQEVEELEKDLEAKQSQLAALKIEVSLTRAEVRDGEKVYRSLVENWEELDEYTTSLTAELDYLRELQFNMRSDLQQTDKKRWHRGQFVKLQSKLQTVAACVLGTLVWMFAIHLLGKTIYKILKHLFSFAFVVSLIAGIVRMYKAYHQIPPAERAAKFRRGKRKVRRLVKNQLAAGGAAIPGAVAGVAFLAFIIYTSPERAPSPVPQYFTDPQQSITGAYNDVQATFSDAYYQLEKRIQETQSSFRDSLDKLNEATPDVGEIYDTIKSSKLPAQAVQKVTNVAKSGVEMAMSVPQTVVDKVQGLRDSNAPTFADVKRQIKAAVNPEAIKMKTLEMSEWAQSKLEQMQSEGGGKEMVDEMKSSMKKRAEQAKSWFNDRFLASDTLVRLQRVEE